VGAAFGAPLSAIGGSARATGTWPLLSERGAATPAARLLLSCLQHPSAWLAPGASSSAVERLRASCSLSAHCKTGRAGSRMPVPPWMQGWPVGVPVGHVLLLHASRSRGEVVAASRHGGVMLPARNPPACRRSSDSAAPADERSASTA
jgi:hypothetical protein